MASSFPPPSSSPSPPPPTRPTSQSHSSSPSPPAPESNSIPPPKKSPPLPWTHEETVALIKAYQEKWYSLKKGQLKASQWEEVSVTVAARCGFDEPSRTSTQCRHKIEKLRKRYRLELQNPLANSWQYFELMDQMERGPFPLNAHPISAVKSFSGNSFHSNSNISNDNAANGYGSLYSNSADYYNRNRNRNGGDGGGVSDESDEKSNMGYNNDNSSAEFATKNKSKSINNIVRGEVKTAKRTPMKRRFSGCRNPINGKRKKQYYDGDGDDDDNDDDDNGDVEEERGGGGSGGGAVELAAEIRWFTEEMTGIENKKIEMMRETQSYRMEIEKKRMKMILDAERKIIDIVDRAFGAH